MHNIVRQQTQVLHPQALDHGARWHIVDQSRMVAEVVLHELEKFGGPARVAVEEVPDDIDEIGLGDYRGLLLADAGGEENGPYIAVTSAENLQHFVDHVPVHNVALSDRPALRNDRDVIFLARLGALGANFEFAPVAPTSCLSSPNLPAAVVAVPPIHAALPPWEEVVLEFMPFRAYPGGHRLPPVQHSDKVFAHHEARILNIHLAEQRKILQFPRPPLSLCLRLCGEQVLAEEGFEAGVRDLAQAVDIQQLELVPM
mmetsp:Transcript_116851/g.229212  ORF Transcript_116851/g.229212 Transcript_116851/m.229212 type:complete len:257 (-) Transcript_116851:132-902(-)